MKKPYTNLFSRLMVVPFILGLLLLNAGCNSRGTSKKITKLAYKKLMKEDYNAVRDLFEESSQTSYSDSRLITLKNYLEDRSLKLGGLSFLNSSLGNRGVVGGLKYDDSYVHSAVYILDEDRNDRRILKVLVKCLHRTIEYPYGKETTSSECVLKGYEYL